MPDTTSEDLMALGSEAPNVGVSGLGRSHPSSRLAIAGGQAAVRSRFSDRWRQIRAAEIWEILKLALRDQHTATGGANAVSRLERSFAKSAGTRYALAMNSGTAAIHSALFAVGVKPEHEVIVPTYTFPASATPILQCGAHPVFCDIDPVTLTLDPDDVERRITSRTRAICAVHVWGNPAALDRLVEIKDRHKLALIEDCSHAPGATYQGRPVGSWGDVGCFSLQGSKAVSGGEAGIATTNDPKLFDKMLVLGHFGRPQRHQQAASFDVGPFSLGLKYRPHLYAMVLANGALSRLPELNRRRRRNYALLAELLRDCPAVQAISTYPEATRGGLLEFIFTYHPRHAGGWNRAAFVRALQAEGVPISADRYTRIADNARLLHESPLFTDLDFSQLGGYLGGNSNESRRFGPFPVAEELAEQLVSIPALTRVSDRFIRQCAAAIKKVARCACEVGDLREL